MKSRYKIWGIGLLMGLMSCSEQEIVEVQSQGKQITATAVSSGSTSVFSRLAFEDKQAVDGGVGITWADGDKFYLKNEAGNAYAYMDISEGETGKKTALFTGNLIGELAENELVSAFYPSSAYEPEKNHFNVDLRTMTQDCTSGNEMNHLSASYYMIGNGRMEDGAIGVSFVGGTKVAMLRFDLTLPKQTTAGLTVKELLIVCDDLKTIGTMASDGTFTPDEAQEKHRQTITLENLNASTTEETTFSVYVNVLPVTLNSTMRLKAMLSDETVYWCDVDLTNVELKANNRYYLVRGFLEAQKVGVDESWYTNNQSATTFYVYDEADLRGLAKLVNRNIVFKNKTILLMDDINLKVDWVPIGYAEADGKYSFCGHFDGQNHVIRDIYCDEELITDISFNAVGFFGVTKAATIENLTLHGIVKSKIARFVGGIVGRNIGGVLSVLKNCHNKIHVSSTYSKSENLYVGGVIGYTYSTSIIECSNSGTLKAIASKARMGGVVGGFSGINNNTKVKIMACYNEGIMESSSSTAIMGGIVASFYNRAYKVPIIACYNLSEKLITDESEAEYQGGIIGYANSDSDTQHYIYGCYTVSETLFGGKTDSTVIDESSCLVLASDNVNAQDKADVLNDGILAWNEKEDIVKGNSTHGQYCNYHFEVGTGTNHLVVAEGAPIASTTTPEEEPEL